MDMVIALVVDVSGDCLSSSSTGNAQNTRWLGSLQYKFSGNKELTRDSVPCHSPGKGEGAAPVHAQSNKRICGDKLSWLRPCIYSKTKENNTNCLHPRALYTSNTITAFFSGFPRMPSISYSFFPLRFQISMIVPGLLNTLLLSLLL
jgi:hypothetical protein